jgi:ArsR family metal-binding transcriptional regulator
MLLKEYTFETMLPECNPMAETINAVAELSDDISAVLPYLASIVKVCSYDDETKIMTFRHKGKGIAMYPRKITVTKLIERAEAGKILDELKDLINQTYENRQNIKPCYKKGGELKYLDVFRFLPGTNCKECGQPTCLAFAIKLVLQKVSITQCLPIFSGQFEEKRKKLLVVLQTAGYEVPTDEIGRCG